MGRVIAATGWTVFLAIAASGYAQTAPAPSTDMPAGAGSIMQITVKRRPMETDVQFRARAKAFAATARSITSCEQANAYAIETRAAMAVTAPPRFVGMPPQLVQALRSRPLGHPTPPFGKVEQGVRILILCPTGFQLTPPPAKAGPANEI
jgi:hypothetical protein